MYDFTETQDWFSHNVPSWRELFPLVDSKHPRVLEIGSWEGRSAVFLLEELCKGEGEIICIDHFDLFRTEAGKERFKRIQHNLASTGFEGHRVLPQFSTPALMQLLHEEMDVDNPGFDWVYIDGSHEADDTLLDGELVWRLARKGAIVIFDDYHWDKEPETSIHHPKRGVDAFTTLHSGQFECLTAPDHYQVVLRKTTDMRIGFLASTHRGDPATEASALGQGIHIAVTVDSSFAVAAAVAMRSVADRTDGRISFYVVDCGLDPRDRERIESSMPNREDLTLKYVGLPADALAHGQGATWAKIDMISVLPVERVLYLDADTLTLASLKELWQIDLEGRALGAVIDVGHPMGHKGIQSKPYFNAGVLLLDLAVIRKSLPALRSLSESMSNSAFRDQDVLNTHFAVWKDMDLRWNAQGLGTYADHVTKERMALPLSNMNNASVVHFTGPVYPSVAEVLNPWVQPPTAKPWGYLGAPGHPFEAEWFRVLEKTSWKGMRASKEWNDECERQVERALEKTSKSFKAKLVVS